MGKKAYAVLDTEELYTEFQSLVHLLADVEANADSLKESVQKVADWENRVGGHIQRAEKEHSLFHQIIQLVNGDPELKSRLQVYFEGGEKSS